MMHETGQWESRECVHLQYRGKSLGIPVARSCTLRDLAKYISAATGAAQSTLKLLSGGRTCLPWKAPQQLVRDAGLLSGNWLLLASSEAELQGVRNSRDLPGLPSFEHEEAREALRSRPSQATKLPSGPYTFQSFKAWQPPEGVQPGTAHALALLHRLAADPGIVAVMRGHRWSVGLLAEMPPEGFVGVSPVCILGYNTNKGQEVHLRLRTDDLKGFRRYQPIRDTLIHELAHNVHSAHDNLFKTLNSQLQKECLQHSGSGRTLAGSDHISPAAEATSQTAPPKAHKLVGALLNAPPTDAATAAAAAALVRSQRNSAAMTSLDKATVVSRTVSENGTTGKGATAGISNRSPASLQPGVLSNAADCIGSKTSSNSNSAQPVVSSAPAVEAAISTNLRLHDSIIGPPQHGDDIVEGLGHRNTASERDEAAMAALGALPHPLHVSSQSAAVSPSPKLRAPLTLADGQTPSAGPGAGRQEVPLLPPRHLQRSPPACPSPDLPGSRASTDHAHCQASGSSPPQQQHYSSNAASQLPTKMDISHLESQSGALQPAAGSDREPDAIWPDESSLSNRQPQIGHPHSQPADIADTTHDARPQPGSSILPSPCPSPPMRAEDDPMGISHPGSQHGSPSASEYFAASELSEAMHESQADTNIDTEPSSEVTKRLARFWEVLDLLRSAAVDMAQLHLALQSLQKILQNVLTSPGDERVRRIRSHNPAFQHRVGCLSPAVDYLKLAGFESSQEGQEAVLKLRRNDPGLIWLALIVVQEQTAKVQ